MKEHDKRKEFKCSECDLEFFLEWLLNRHIRGHKEVNRKFCHYFNNGKVCPFYESGCRFRHEHSEVCFYGQSCTNHLCQYQHNQIKMHNDEKNNEWIEKFTTDAEVVEVQKLKDELDKANERMNLLKDDLENKVEKNKQKQKADTRLQMNNESKRILEYKLKQYSDSLGVLIKEKEDWKVKVWGQTWYHHHWPSDRLH